MTQAKKHILPFFIPHLGCPQQCIFCDQRRIAGRQQPPKAEQVAAALCRLPVSPQPVYELAFYGGSFTALPPERQIYYLEPARRAIEEGRIAGVRVSTRPDCIDAAAIRLLQAYGVTTVELGVQSMTERVLQRAKRGHTVAAAIKALQMLQEAGLVAGVQLMPGLPGETLAQAWAGAQRLLAYRPQLLRIYPTVVLAGTECAAIWQRGEYQPLTLAAAAGITLAIRLLAEDLGVQVIRMGLQPSEELAAQVLAGPYHPAFGGLVQGLYWRYKTLAQLQKWPHTVQICANQRDMAALVGLNKQNLPFYRQAAPGVQVKRAAEALPAGALLLRQADGSGVLAADSEFRQSWRGLLPLLLQE